MVVFYRFKKYLVFLAALIGIMLFLFINNNSKEATNIEADLIEVEDELDNHVENLDEPIITAEEIHVDIKGAVKDPGVYQLKTEQRVYEAVEAAGGFDKTANRDGINLATKLQDEMLVYVPFIGDEEFNLPLNQNSQDNTDTGIHINSATQAELETLTGIGPAKAQAILQHIEENGPFQDVSDLLNISGIGEKTLEKFADDLIIP